jgi:DNA processing protein
LIKQGAKLVDSVDDIFEEYPDLQVKRDKESADAQDAGLNLGEPEAAVYALISLEPVHMDDIIARADLSPTEASHILLLLQLEDLIEEAEGGRYIRKL